MAPNNLGRADTGVLQKGFVLFKKSLLYFKFNLILKHLIML